MEHSEIDEGLKPCMPLSYPSTNKQINLQYLQWA